MHDTQSQLGFEHTGSNHTKQTRKTLSPDTDCISYLRLAHLTWHIPGTLVGTHMGWTSRSFPAGIRFRFARQVDYVMPGSPASRIADSLAESEVIDQTTYSPQLIEMTMFVKLVG